MCLKGLNFILNFKPVQFAHIYYQNQLSHVNQIWLLDMFE